MQRSWGQPRRRRPRSPSDTLMPTERLDPIVTYAPFRLSVRVNSATGVVCPAPQRIRSLCACSGSCVSGRTMIATCANPACNEPFRYFRSGKIFMLETIDANDLDPGSRTDPSKRRIEYFWLCGACAPAMHLMRTTNGAVTLCQSPRGPSDPLGALRIVFARELTSHGLKHRRFSGIST